MTEEEKQLKDHVAERIDSVPEDDEHIERVIQFVVDFLAPQGHVQGSEKVVLLSGGDGPLPPGVVRLGEEVPKMMKGYEDD